MKLINDFGGEERERVRGECRRYKIIIKPIRDIRVVVFVTKALMDKRRKKQKQKNLKCLGKIVFFIPVYI